MKNQKNNNNNAGKNGKKEFMKCKAVRLNGKIHLEYENGRRTDPLKDANETTVFESGDFVNQILKNNIQVPQWKDKDGNWHTITDPSCFRMADGVEISTPNGRQFKANSDGKKVKGITYKGGNGKTYAAKF